MDSIKLAPFNHTIHSLQPFHTVMMTESAEELKLEFVIETALAGGYGDGGREKRPTVLLVGLVYAQFLSRASHLCE
jgi:hypothetical protein